MVTLETSHAVLMTLHVTKTSTVGEYVRFLASVASATQAIDTRSRRSQGIGGQVRLVLETLHSIASRRCQAGLGFNEIGHDANTRSTSPWQQMTGAKRLQLQSVPSSTAIRTGTYLAAS